MTFQKSFNIFQQTPNSAGSAAVDIPLEVSAGNLPNQEATVEQTAPENEAVEANHTTGESIL